ncbi:hypothetical protein PLICRDRAFT_456974 [Plicaturopsis crispa FD-325 SS-3]|nr:hypothetical protein PLICRDRAFT_456974 [Plicaturopsis crispa FD-325 SS-3]
MNDLNLQSVASLSSGHSIPLLGFGVYKNFNTEASVLEAFRAGYRHIDSAQIYRNEAAVGEAVRDSGLQRGDVFITTKCTCKTHGYESTLQGVEDSLARFGFDYVDLFLIHDPFSGPAKRLATYRALLEKRDAGKIKSVGVSNYGIHHIEEIMAAGLELPAVNQIELHPFCQQKPIVEFCRAHGIFVQAYCPMIHGKMDHPVIMDLATKLKRDPAQILIRWSLQKGFSPLLKSATPSRIVSNARVYDFELSPEDMSALDMLDKGADGAVSWNPVGAP